MNKDKIPTITADHLPNTSILFLFLAPLIIFYYGSFVFDFTNMGNPFLYLLQVIADGISIMTLLGLWLTIFLDVFVLPHHRIHVSKKENPIDKDALVDVFITTAGEPFELVEETLRAAIAITYPHQTFILDDGKSDDLKALCENLGAKYVIRSNHNFAKAGNINNGLKHSTAEFFVIFDADQVAEPDFLDQTLPYLADPTLSMVQTPQYFINRKNFIAAGSAYAQEVFYRYLSPAKNISDSAFCVGTNVVFRRKAIEQIGGIASIGHSEDIWTSRLLHEAGWKTIFLNQILAKGRAPETIRAYFRQQLRWAKGGFSMLFLFNPLTSQKLKLDQRIQYFTANAFYLVGFPILMYILFPIIYLLFGISPLDAENTLQWLIHYLPYLLLYYSLTTLMLGHLRVSLVSTALATFYPYLLAFFSTVFNTQENWTPTSNKQSGISAIMQWVWPHVLILLLSAFALIVGWFDPTSFWETLFNTVWILFNMYLLITFLTSAHSEEMTSNYDN